MRTTNMVKYIREILVITIVVGLASTVQASTIALGTVSGSPGETVLVPVNIDNTAGRTSCNISVAFDNTKVRFLGRDKGNMEAGIIGPKAADVNKQGKYDPIISFCEEATAGTLMYLKFTVRENVKGDIPLTLTVPTPAGVFNTANGKIIVR